MTIAHDAREQSRNAESRDPETAAVSSRDDAQPTDDLVQLEIAAQFSDDDLLGANHQIQPSLVSALASSSGETARRHLVERRRLPSWLLAEEELGHVPSARFLLDAARRMGIPLECGVEAGLLRRSVWAARQTFRDERGRAAVSTEELSAFFQSRLAENPRYYRDYPLLRGADGAYLRGDWLTIPIRSREQESGTLAIAGYQYRSLRPEQDIGKGGRYCSPRNTRILDWSNTLIGLAEEYACLAQSGSVVISEGKFDQLAIKAAVREWPAATRPASIALGGMAARGLSTIGMSADRTNGPLGILRGKRVAIFLDSEAAADAAALRLASQLEHVGVSVGVVQLVEQWSVHRGMEHLPKDPGEAWEREGGAVLRDAIVAAMTTDLTETVLRTQRRRASKDRLSGTTWQRLRALDATLDQLLGRPSGSRPLPIDRVAEALSLDPRVVVAAIEERERIAVAERTLEPRTRRRHARQD